MKKELATSALIFLSLFSLSAKKTTINNDWKFNLTDNANAKCSNFQDNSWRVLNVPHDWSFELGYSKDGAQKDFGGYASGGVAWYRKKLNISKEDMKSAHVFIDFDGVYMNSEVWINNNYLGKRPYGYISFSYEISKYIHQGENTISVRVDNSLEPSARWYHACGIYGNVYLNTKSNAYIDDNATIITTPDIKQHSATVNVATNVISDIKQVSDIECKILDAKGNVIATKSLNKVALKVGDNKIATQLPVENISLWSPENPNLYKLNLTIKDNNKTKDTYTSNLGFRSLDWKIDSGFYLNGKQYKLRGVCEHLEGGPIGGFSSEVVLRWKLKKLKAMGCNAIRTAHNPQIPLFYDLCDEMGILVMDEMFDGWHKKAPNDYGSQAFNEWWERDLRAWIRRDRNHPSVFLYSVGNETSGDVAKDLVKVCHQEDNTRLVTSGDSNPEDMDVYGVNGFSERKEFIDSFAPTTKPFIGTENPHTWQVRGLYRTKTWYRDGYKSKKQDPLWIPDLTDNELFTYDWIAPEKRANRKQLFNSSYDNATVRVTSRHIIEMLRDKPWFSGSFRWTGYDYLGEAGFVHGGWPFKAFQGGVFDLAGFEKDLFYLYQSEWTNKDMAHILPHWTHPTFKGGELVPVWVYTTGDEAELFINGKSLGKKKKGSTWDTMQIEWKVPYTPGKLETVAYRNGKEIARDSQITSGAPSKLGITIEGNKALKADKQDVSIITISELDNANTLYPYGENRIFTSLKGDAQVLSFESGNPVDTECNFNATSKNCFFGLNRIFVQSTSCNNKPVYMVIGAICGDKKLMLSDKISINVNTIALRGKVTPKKYEIRYTTDGTIPTKKSKIYTSPFAIQLGTTVKATIYDDNNAILQMSENFSQEEGLYWGNK